MIFFSFLICYLEWGKDSSSFVYQTEYSLLFERDKSTDTFTHPFILIPLIGQLIILISVFSESIKRKFVITGIAFQALLVLMLFFIGLLSVNFKILISTLPFLVFSSIYIYKTRKKAEVASDASH